MRHEPLLVRFWAGVPTERPEDGCWLWTKSVVRSGYGSITDRGKFLGAHRVSWMAHKGPIPDGMWVLHRCDTPACVNPRHLFLGDRTANVRDMFAKGRGRPGKSGGPPPGEKNGRALLTAPKVIDIRTRAAAGITVADLAREYSMSEGALRHIVKRRHWRHVP